MISLRQYLIIEEARNCWFLSSFSLALNKFLQNQTELVTPLVKGDLYFMVVKYMVTEVKSLRFESLLLHY